MTVCSLPIAKPTQTADFLTYLWGNYIDACMTLKSSRFYTAMMDCLGAWLQTESILLGKLDPPTGCRGAWTTPWYRWGPLHETLQCGALILQHVPTGLWANCVPSRDAKHILKSDVGAMLSGSRILHVMDLKVDVVGSLVRGLPAKAYARRDKQDERLAALVLNFTRCLPGTKKDGIRFHEHGSFLMSFLLSLPTACWLSKTLNHVQRCFACAFTQFCLRVMKQHVEASPAHLMYLTLTYSRGPGDGPNSASSRHGPTESRLCQHLPAKGSTDKPRP